MIPNGRFIRPQLFKSYKIQIIFGGVYMLALLDERRTYFWSIELKIFASCVSICVMY